MSDLKANVIDAVDSVTRSQSQSIIDEVKSKGSLGFKEVAIRLGDLPNVDAPYLMSKEQLKEGFLSLPKDQQELLERVAYRVRTFALAQLKSISEVEVKIPGGVAGHYIAPVEVAACYAPGGRYPLPSSVLMTSITARAAGVRNVIVASPRPAPITIGAAYVAGADALVTVGGAQAIAAFAYGTVEGIPKADVIVGPGNKWVTAAKAIVNGICNIDMLAGPSECLVLADDSADPKVLCSAVKLIK